MNWKFYCIERKHFKLHVNAGRLMYLQILNVSIWFRDRSSKFRTEWHNHNGVRWFNISWGNPIKHCWWAMNIYFHF